MERGDNQTETNLTKDDLHKAQNCYETDEEVNKRGKKARESDTKIR